MATSLFIFRCSVREEGASVLFWSWAQLASRMASGLRARAIKATSFGFPAATG